ncbi:hypothetical protein [Variovorax saccharolyticus]|uniref:hypothetical protein n=1 Tax=Variovorax saccharolyticus TaxID=3053516 RepID=UPI0025774F31|nr:hypothetical protein [Variovorax sp. J31P216]MDM0028390.1 hypothetical protein [Variovorax sp. J31P216]
MARTAPLGQISPGKGAARLARVRVKIANLEQVVREIAPDCDPNEIERDIEQLLPAVIALRESRQSVRREELVRLFIGDAAPRPVDIVRARMQAEARKRVFSGTDWATAAQIADLAELGQKNPSGTVNRWKQQRQIFALHVSGKDWYPKYALGENFRPLPAMAEVMAAVVDWRAQRLASWFEAKSSSLSGQRPRELIATNPQLVVDAAKRVVIAEAHNR